MKKFQKNDVSNSGKIDLEKINVKKPKKYAVLTSGGDSPGMNATIYGFVAQCLLSGHEPYVVREGYVGLIQGLIEPIDFDTVKYHAQEAGSFIGCSRSLAFQNDIEQRKICVKNLKDKGIDGLFIIGGDGSYRGAIRLMELDFPVITAPGTVDNDVASSEVTIGFTSAAQEIYEAIGKIRSTSRSHKSVMLVEVMGRNRVDLSVYSGVAGLVDGIVTQENIFYVEDFLKVISTARANNQRDVIFLIAENTYGKKHGFNLPSLPEMAKKIEEKSGYTTRVNVLGYLQRGAKPTFHEMILGISFGRRAMDLFNNSKHSIAIGSNGWSFLYQTPLVEAVKMETFTRVAEIEWNNALVMGAYLNNKENKK